MKHFDITELVDKDVYQLHKENAIRFFDPRILEIIDWIRENIDRPITINNWNNGGTFSQRGLRHNRSNLVKSKNRIYLSAHVLGMAFDFDVEGKTAKEVRGWIVAHKDELPYSIRLEKDVSWVHIDVATTSEEKINWF